MLPETRTGLRNVQRPGLIPNFLQNILWLVDNRVASKRYNLIAESLNPACFSHALLLPKQRLLRITFLSVNNLPERNRHHLERPGPSWLLFCLSDLMHARDSNFPQAVIRPRQDHLLSLRPLQDIPMILQE